MSVPGHPRIFVNYRRGDVSHAAARLCDQLIKHFEVFLDVDSIRGGMDFVAVMTHAVTTSNVLLAIIGSGWVSITDSKGRRRLEDPNDYVRLEIQTALDHHVPVIPVLIDDAAFPDPQDIPDRLRPMMRINGRRLRHESFRSDSDRLIADIKRLSEADTPVIGTTPTAAIRREQDARQVQPAYTQEEPQPGDPHYFENMAREAFGFGPRLNAVGLGWFPVW